MPVAPRLVASYFTLAGDIVPFASDAPSPHSLRNRAEAAAQVGYVGLGLDLCDLRHQRETIGYQGIRRVLADAGLDYLELEVLTDWFVEGAHRAASDLVRAEMLEAANELGVAQIKAVGTMLLAEGDDAGAVPEGVPIDKVGEEFGKLCREAARADTRVSIELVPGSSIADLATARRIVEGAGERNGGMLIDIWHMARGGIAYESLLDLPPHLITAVELDDAMQVQIGTIFEDTVRNRKLPGEGELDVPRFLQCIRDTGYRGVFGVEIVSDEHRARALVDAASSSFTATMGQFGLI